MKNKITASSPVLKYSLFITLISGLLACSNESRVGTDRSQTADASYRVTFTTNWTAADFPTNFPSAAHFSGLIGGTHNDQIKFWETGQPATFGIESMAETGSQVALSAEIEAAKAEGKAEFVLGGDGAAGAGSTMLEFDINQGYPLVTLVSMVAPSPDWFVGVRDLSLYDSTAGDWKPSLVANLAVYDAGSDNGTGFTAADADAQPGEPISLLTSNPTDTDFVNGLGPVSGSKAGFIATMSFERIK